MIQRKPVLFVSWGGRVTATLLGRELEHYTMTHCGKCFYPQVVHLLWALFFAKIEKLSMQDCHINTPYHSQSHFLQEKMVKK